MTDTPVDPEEAAAARLRNAVEMTGLHRQGGTTLYVTIPKDDGAALLTEREEMKARIARLESAVQDAREGGVGHWRDPFNGDCDWNCRGCSFESSVRALRGNTE